MPSLQHAVCPKLAGDIIEWNLNNSVLPNKLEIFAKKKAVSELLLWLSYPIIIDVTPPNGRLDLQMPSDKPSYLHGGYYTFSVPTFSVRSPLQRPFRYLLQHIMLNIIPT